VSNKTYTVVSLNEIKDVLKSEKGWKIVTEPKSREYIFEFPLTESPHIVIRVCSSIIETGKSRDCGKDAIRIYAVDIKNHKGYIKTRRVYRIGTWKKNLQKTVLDCFYAAQQRRDKR